MILEYLGLRLTTYCNLNCKECADLIPKQKNCHYDYNLLIEDMDKILSSVDYIEQLLLGGGEIFLYPHVEAVIDYCAASPKIGKIIIVTNGTIIPSEKIMKKIKEEKVIMRISGYREEVAPKRAELIQRIKREQIPLEDFEGMVWRKIGNEEYRNRDIAELKKIYQQCQMKACVGMNQLGRIYYCSRSMAADTLNIYPKPKPEEYVDVRDSKPEELTEKLKQFYELEYISTCNYCDGLVPNSPFVPAAVQIVPKGIIMDLLQYEVQLKEGIEDTEVVMSWLRFVVDNQKHLVYEDGYKEMLSYTLNM